ncbi:hypothetical protein CR970_04595 [Candidatus Saccharibacteria bacterium]|nr:MAG: hypothetical protein CR970_04595 [Candidatus Saccharibacteria bacterium]
MTARNDQIGRMLRWEKDTPSGEVVTPLLPFEAEDLFARSDVLQHKTGLFDPAIVTIRHENGSMGYYKDVGYPSERSKVVTLGSIATVRHSKMPDDPKRYFITGLDAELPESVRGLVDEDVIRLSVAKPLARAMIDKKAAPKTEITLPGMRGRSSFAVLAVNQFLAS